jgi:hypothetical protein
MSYPYVIRGLDVILTCWKAGRRWKNSKKKRKNTDRWHISATILAWRRRPVAFGTALDPLRWLMRLVTYRRTNRVSETADKYGTFSYFFYGIRTCRPSGAILPEYSPDGGVRWLFVKPWTPSIGRYRRCWVVASARPSKRVTSGCICSSLTISRST